MEGSRARAWRTDWSILLRTSHLLGSNFAKDKSNLLFGTVFLPLLFFFGAGVKFWESMGLQDIYNICILHTYMHMYIYYTTYT